VGGLVDTVVTKIFVQGRADNADDRPAGHFQLNGCPSPGLGERIEGKTEVMLGVQLLQRHEDFVSNLLRHGYGGVERVEHFTRSLLTLMLALMLALMVTLSWMPRMTWPRLSTSIILTTAISAGKTIPGSLDGLEHLQRLSFVTNVRVITPSQAPVSHLDFSIAGACADIERCIGVHNQSIGSSGSTVKFDELLLDKCWRRPYGSVLSLLGDDVR
jgi:hypothetical protein